MSSAVRPDARNPLGLGRRPLPAWAVRWMMSLFPPLWVNGVAVRRLSADYRRLTVTIRQGFLNRNLQGTIWGGAYLSAADPWYGILLWLALKSRGLDTFVFSQYLTAEFKKQGRGTLVMEFELTEAVLADAIATLQTVGKWVHPFEVSAVDAQGQVCFTATVTMNLRRPDYRAPATSAAEPPSQAGLPL